MDGILLLDKPSGLSSYGVIRHLKKIIREQSSFARTTERHRPKQSRVGHAGTLDPMATGLLIVLLGSACKQADQFLKLDKSYEAEITLGSTSSTDDAEGEIQEVGSRGSVDRRKINNVLKEFTGEIEQVPPQYSAIKVGGQRAYAMARRGQTVELSPRTVKVYSIDLESYHYPKLQINTSVSSGTYIRSLVRDIGQKLGTGAYLSGLRRTSVGTYLVKNSIQLNQLTYESVKKNIIVV